jgi:flavin-dependent dehydrogenase
MRRKVAFNNSYLGKRAIVVGAGLSGLSAARVLADYFDEVIILDRDQLPDDAIARPGVPQGKQPHGLLGGGLKALENLFPGFGSELIRAGAEPIDAGFDMLAEVPGQVVWPRIKLNWPSRSMSRPLIERTLRRQVERIRNVKVKGGCRVLNIVRESNGDAATGIQCQLVAGGLETHKSDLVVDASGNGSLTAEFLKSSGRKAPEETRIGVNIRYASAFFERSPIRNGYKIVFTFPNSPDQGRGGIILPVENNCHHVVLSGRSKDIPPTDGNEFLNYARRLPTLTIYNAIKDAKRLTDIVPFSFPESRWRHFPWAMSAIPDFVYPDTIGERPPDLVDRLNFQRALGRLAARDTEIHKLLVEIRHVLKPLSLLDDHFIVRRVEEEMANVSPTKESPTSVLTR